VRLAHPPADDEGGEQVGIGGSIFLIALGAIFAFALDINVGWLDINVVGWVLMLAGVVGLILTLWFWQSRRRQVVTTTPVTTTAPPARVANDGVVEEQYRVRRTDQPY
jgi:hypothetical protein